MKNKALRRYLHKIKRNLTCYHATKKELMAGVSVELREETMEADSYPAIVARFGEPEAVAAQLQESVSEGERSAARRRSRLLRIAAIAVVLAIITALAIMTVKLWNTVPVTYDSVIYEGTSPDKDTIWEQ